MRTHRATAVAKTSSPVDIVDITDDVLEAARTSELSHGHVMVYSPETGCSLIVNERESGLLSDMKAAIERINGNGRALSAGTRSTVLPLVDGTLRLGAWQRIMLIELEEPSERTVVVQVIGE